MGIVITDLAKFYNLSGGTHVSVEGRSGLGENVQCKAMKLVILKLKSQLLII